jgi:tetratricopeptide (TPR) repeat protein
LEYGDKYYTEILETRKDLWIKFYNDGVPLFNDKKYSEAVTFFELALLIDPENIDGFKERGLCYVMMSTLEKDSIKAKELEDKALSDFDYIIARDPEGKELPIRINKASIFYRNGQYDKAEPVYLEILKFDPQNIDAISKLALIYQNAGESEKAIEMYDKVTKTNPNNPDLWFNMGILYFQMGNFAKAQESFDKVLDMNPNDVETMMNLVSSFWKAEMYKEAIPYLERVVAIEPMNVLAWQFLSVAYAKNGETTKANEAFKKYKELGGTIK